VVRCSYVGQPRSHNAFTQDRDTFGAARSARAPGWVIGGGG